MCLLLGSLGDRLYVEVIVGLESIQVRLSLKKIKAGVIMGSGLVCLMFSGLC